MDKKNKLIEDFAKKHKVWIIKHPFRKTFTSFGIICLSKRHIEPLTEPELLMLLYHELGHSRLNHYFETPEKEQEALIFSINQMMKEGYKLNDLIEMELKARKRFGKTFEEKYGLTIKEIKEELLLQEVMK